MEPIDIYLMYCAMKAHFGKSDYDFIKYEGKSKVSRDSFWKRKDRSFFDQDNAEELKYWNDNVDPYIADKSGQKIWQMLKGASHGWDEPRTPLKYYVQNTVVVKRGKNQDFMNIQRRLKQMMSETEYTGNRAVFRLNSGGNNQTFMVINGFDSHAASFSNNLPEETNFADAYSNLLNK